MFRIPNAIQITLVKTNNPDDTTPALVQLPTPEEASEYMTDAAYWTKRAAKGAAVLYVGKKVVDTVQQIVVVAATVHLNK